MSRSLLAALALLAPAPALAQEAAPAEYEVSFPNAAHHEARITVTYSGLTEGEPLTLRMSRSSPGRYAIHEFAKNVYDVRAVNGAGEALSLTRDDPYSWTASGHDGTVSATYTLYADRADGTYSQIDPTHAHLNMPATFMWAEGQEDRPIEVTFEPVDADWKAATQLESTGPMRFRAPDLQYFMDSPTELSDFDMREWTVEDTDGATRTIRLAVHHDGTEEDVRKYADMAEAVTRQHIEMWGGVPDYDYGTYTFIADYLPYVSGDGMEHRNSTILTSSQGLYRAEFDQLGTLSHEFFHAWNVERLRPAELQPFDFTKANPTPSLWFAEGFTSYYGPLMIRRAGQSDYDEYLEELSGLVDGILNAPGRQFASPKEMSLRAPFVDAATAIDPVNFRNTFTSYYPYGAVIALALDLTLRQEFDDITLDDYMRHMWETHGVTEDPYTPDDLRAGLAEVTGDEDFANDFFARYVDDSELPDLAPLLEQAGLTLKKKNEGDAWLGPVRLEKNGEAVMLAGNTTIASPLYEAGLDRGDEIVRVGRFQIDSQDDWDATLDRHEPGDTVEIAYIQRGAERSADITFAEDETMEIVLDDDASRRQTSFREAWLGEDSAEDEEEN